MNARKRSLLQKMTLGVVLGIATLVGLQACSRGAWHSPERMEKKFRWVEEDLAEDLESREEQREGYLKLTARYKALIRERISGSRETVVRVNSELERDNPDVDAIVALVKQHIRERPTNEQLELLVDESAAFFRTLDPEQQDRVRKLVSKRIGRHL